MSLEAADAGPIRGCWRCFGYAKINKWVKSPSQRAPWGGGVLRPSGATGCSHGWSAARRQAGGAEPVETVTRQRGRPGRGGGNTFAPAGATKTMKPLASTGSASAGYAVAPLHPWRPAAPSERNPDRTAPPILSPTRPAQCPPICLATRQRSSRIPQMTLAVAFNGVTTSPMNTGENEPQAAEI